MRVLQGDVFRLRLAGSVVRNVDAFVLVRYEDGKMREFKTRVASPGDRTENVNTLPGVVLRDGEIVRAYLDVEGVVGLTKRGQVYANLAVADPNLRSHGVLLQGYVYDKRPLGMGDLNGPAQGMGHLDWIQFANDIAGNVPTTFNLAVTGARRLYRGVLIKYHCSGDAATRVLVLRVRNLGDTSGPTGFAIDQDTWVSPQLTMTINEEGILYVGKEGFLMANDEGTLTYSNNTTVPQPFPLWVEAGETGDLVIGITDGHANDDYDAFVFVEEWLE